jgi:peptide chain release factor
MSAAGILTGEQKRIRATMARLKISEEDLEEQFIRSSQKGGQNVNKVSTCVFLRHRPSGMTVKCQEERGQGINRLLARKRLLAKIEQARETERNKIAAQRWLLRQKARRRSVAQKEEVLQNKKFNARKKEARRAVSLKPGED